MTAAGFALIAGGLATLIGFRRALWAGGGRRKGPAPPIEPPRRRELTAPAPVRALPSARRAELTAAPASVPAAAAPAEEAMAVEPDEVLDAPADRDVDAESAQVHGQFAPGDGFVPGDGEYGSDDREYEPGDGESDEGHHTEAAGEIDGNRADGDELAAAHEAAYDREFGHEGVESDGCDDDAEEDEDDVREQARYFEDYAAPGADRIEEDEPPHRRMARAVLARSWDVHPELAGINAASLFATPSTGGGDHVEGWVRPQYDDEPSGDYWTPVPHNGLADLDNAPYGWPTPVERLPLVPLDQDSADEPEPTDAFPQWPPAQPSGTIELPRRGRGERRRRLTGEEAPWLNADRDGRDGWERAGGPALSAEWPGEWSDAPEPQRAYGPEDSDSWPVNKPVQPQRRRGWKRVDDTTHVFPAVVEGEPRRRPRPRPGLGGEAHSTVYRSRHAADQ